MTADAVHIQKLRTLDERVDTLFGDCIKGVQYYDYHKIINEKQIREKVCERLFELYGAKIPIADLIDTMKNSDKDLFVKFRDKQITYDQLKARIAERRFHVSYKVLDDLKGKIEPSFYTDLDKFKPYFKMIYGGGPGKKEITHKDILRDLQPYESNIRCLRSVKHHHSKARLKRPSHCFMSIGRDKGRNVFKVQESAYKEENVYGSEANAEGKERLKGTFSLDRKGKKEADDRLKLV